MGMYRICLTEGGGWGGRWRRSIPKPASPLLYYQLKQKKIKDSRRIGIRKIFSYRTNRVKRKESWGWLCAVGTLFKQQENYPSILKEFSEDQVSDCLGKCLSKTLGLDYRRGFLSNPNYVNGSQRDYPFNCD